MDETKEERLLAALRQAVAAHPAEGVLASGGLDSSTLLALDPTPVAITVVLAGCESSRKPVPEAGCTRCMNTVSYPPGCGYDLHYAGQLATALGLDHRLVDLELEEAMPALEELVSLTRSYDLGLLNDIPLYAGLKEARSLGCRRVWTGEDADTLFAGYGYHGAHDDWPAYLSRAIPHIHPTSARIAQHLGIEVSYPYLDAAVIAVARSLDKADVVTTRAGESAGSFVDQFDEALAGEASRPWGKAVLRRAAERLLPEAIAWRPKTDLMFGSGMCRLEWRLRQRLTPKARRRV